MALMAGVRIKGGLLLPLVPLVVGTGLVAVMVGVGVDGGGG